MNNLFEIFQHATNATDYTPGADAAKAICQLRGQYPYALISTQFGVIDAWRVALIEVRLMQMLVGETM